MSFSNSAKQWQVKSSFKILANKTTDWWDWKPGSYSIWEMLFKVLWGMPRAMNWLKLMVDLYHVMFLQLWRRVLNHSPSAFLCKKGKLTGVFLHEFLFYPQSLNALISCHYKCVLVWSFWSKVFKNINPKKYMISGLFHIKHGTKQEEEWMQMQQQQIKRK